MVNKQKLKNLHQEDISVLNIYTPNAREPTTVVTKKSLLQLKLHISSYTLIVGHFKTALTAMDKSSRQKLNGEIVELTNIMTQMNLINIYRTFHPTKKRIYLFLRTSQNILQNWLYTRSQSKSQQIQENWKTFNCCFGIAVAICLDVTIGQISLKGISDPLFLTSLLQNEQNSADPFYKRIWF